MGHGAWRQNCCYLCNTDMRPLQHLPRKSSWAQGSEQKAVLTGGVLPSGGRLSCSSLSTGTGAEREAREIEGATITGGGAAASPLQMHTQVQTGIQQID